MALLEVDNLKKYFPVQGGVLGRTVGHVKAVDGVSFSLERGETLGLVGESGCGKTTVGRCLLRLIEPTAGRVVFEGRNLLELSPGEMRRTRAGLQIIFQDPFSSLNPRMTVADIVAEPIHNHMDLSPDETRNRVAMLMQRVGLHTEHMHRYPHEFSGGQRQRIGIARALALNPKVMVCDEPVSALDVSIQAQVINLLARLQEQLDLSYLFIAHDLSVVQHISDRVAVMYLGRIVEIAAADALYDDPLHPYSQALMSAVPIPDPDQRREKLVLQGDVPSPLSPPAGCSFHPRCFARLDICPRESPVLTDVGGGHRVACHLYPGQ